MTRFEKIQFIRSSRLLTFAYMNLDITSDNELDQMVQHIMEIIHRQEVSIRGNKLREFYIFLN